MDSILTLSPRSTCPKIRATSGMMKLEPERMVASSSLRRNNQIVVPTTNAPTDEYRIIHRYVPSNGRIKLLGSIFNKARETAPIDNWKKFVKTGPT
jgi:hypothetical protein